MRSSRLFGIALLILAACADNDADARGAPWSFASASDTILLEDREGQVVGELTDLLEWRQRLVVVDGMERNLKTYDLESGELLAVLGRSGDGPGEFRSLAGGVVTHRDELAVLDPLSSRVTVFSATGEPLGSWLLPGAFSGGIDVLPDGDFLLAGPRVRDHSVASDSALHRFSPEGDAIRAYFELPQAESAVEASMNGMQVVVVDSTIIGLQHTSNRPLLHDIRSGRERTDSLGYGFYRPIHWTLGQGFSEDAYQSWIRDQVLAWWLRDMDEHVYVAGFQIWVDSLADWRVRWVFATPTDGQFAESELTDAHPAFIRGDHLYSVRIRPDGRTEMIIGRAPRTGGRQVVRDGSLTRR